MCSQSLGANVLRSDTSSAARDLRFVRSVAPTDASNEIWPKFLGHIDRCIRQLGDIAMIVPGSNIDRVLVVKRTRGKHLGS